MDYITVESMLRALERALHKGLPLIGILIFFIVLYCVRRFVARIMNPISHGKMNRFFISWWDKSWIKGAYIMENMRKKIISVAVVIIILMGVFPPWVEKFKMKDFQLERPLGYAFIFSPPETTNNAYGLSIDFSRLFLQWGIVILVASLFIFLSRKGARD